MLPKIKLRLKKNPIGKMAFIYTSLVMFNLWRPSSTVVDLARIWVIIVANNMCHVVNTIALEVSQLLIVLVGVVLTKSCNR